MTLTENSEPRKDLPFYNINSFLCLYEDVIKDKILELKN